MTHLEDNLKEGIFENSELKLLIQLIEVLSDVPHNNINLNDENEKPLRKRTTLSSSSSDSTRVIHTKEISSSKINIKSRERDFYDDEDIVVVDGDSDLDKAESQDENDSEENFEHDDDDDVEYGQNRLDATLKADFKPILDQDIDENNQEIQSLEKFKNTYQNEFNFTEHKFSKNFEKIQNLLITKRIASQQWLSSCNSNRNLYFILYCLRLLLRDVNFQKSFLAIDNSFSSIAKLLNKYVNNYSSMHNQILIHSHILDLLLNIVTKLLLNESYITSIELNRNGSGNTSNTSNRAGSGNSSNTNSASNKAKKITKIFFDFNLHVSLMQLIENSNELCLVHSSLNILIHIANIDLENRTKLSTDLDISDQLLLILQEYDEDSKKLASKLLCLLLIEDKIKSELTNLDGVQVLLSLLHFHKNLDILWNVIWSLVQLCSYDDNKREIRLMGGIPLILSILCLDFQSDSQTQSTDTSTNKVLVQTNTDNEGSEKRFKAKLQIQAACCALITELAFNETNSYHIVNSNGVYLVISKLLISQTSSSSSNSNQTDNLDRNKEIERLHLNIWRTLRLLFSAERHRSLIKKLLPFSIFEQFVDIGNFKKDLKLYQPLLESFYKLSKEEFESMKQLIQNCNQTQTPKNYINDYAVYEIIGSGAFGRVHKVKKKNSNNFLAMKEINTFNLSSFKDKSLGEIVNEVTIIRNNLKHPNIVRYLKTFKENDNLYIVMELIDGTPLSQHLRTLKEKGELWHEDKIWNLYIQLVLALKYLHKEKHIVHRDLTSNNIMLSENDKITITDFGLAKLKENDCSKMLSVVGTMIYSCPEIIKNEPYNEKADIWAMGCVLYEMCCLEPPFCTSNMLALATKITQSDYDHDRLSRNFYSPLVGQVVQNCLIVEPLKRPDIVGVASLIADKILTYTESIRSKCTSIEKKLEKEKNKTQKMFCNRQDLNYLQRNSTKISNDQIENEDQSSANSSNISQSKHQHKSSIDLLSKIYKAAPNRSTSLTTPFNSSNSNKENELNNKVESLTLDPVNNLVLTTTSKPSCPPSQQATSSPNAKLPPISNPKSKLIMKNLQSKQQYHHQQQIEQQKLANSKLNSSNISLNSEPIQNQIESNTTTLNSEKQQAIVNNNSDNKSPHDNKNLKITQNDNSNKLPRSSSSSILDKRPSQTKKSRPNSANSSSIVPVYKKLRPIEDPIIQILDQIHKILFIAQLPPSGKKNFKRKLVDRYKRSLFSNKYSSMQIKAELMKLIKNSNELIDMEMIGLKSFQYCFNSSESNSLNNQHHQQQQQQQQLMLQHQTSMNSDTNTDLDLILNQNGITYEQLLNIIEELLADNNYYLEKVKHLREELPSID